MSNTEKKPKGRELRFCEEYLIDNNGARAARAAGYSERSARQTAYDLLQKPYIREYINNLEEAELLEKGITRGRILTEFARIAFFDIRQLYNEDGTLKKINELSAEAAAVVAGVEIDDLFDGFGEERTHVGYTQKVKLNNKLDALRALFKRYEDNQTKGVTVKTGKPGADDDGEKEVIVTMTF